MHRQTQKKHSRQKNERNCDREPQRSVNNNVDPNNNSNLHPMHRVYSEFSASSAER